MNNKLPISILNKKSFIAKKNYKGFTLIEFLIVFGILGVIGAVVLSVLFVTLRVSKKSDLLVRLKQSGNSVMSQVSRNIRYAKSLDYPDSCVGGVSTSYVTVTSLTDGEKITFSCISSSSGFVIASNGAALIDTATIYASTCAFYCSQPSLSDPPSINFNFRLHSIGSNSLVETRASLPFQTSVILRNYNKQ
jgi:type II secretory pathway pseudopilin PulG